MNKKRVLHISKFFYPYYGGIEDVVYTIIKGLKNNYDQQVICFSERSRTYSELIDGIPVTRVGICGILFSQPLPIGYKCKLKQVLRSFQPDIIHVHLPNPWICACLSRLDLGQAKVVVHWHADILGKRLLYRLIEPYERRILQRADDIIATSREYVSLSNPLQAYRDKIVILPNTINENKLSLSEEDAVEIQRIRDRYLGRPLVLFIGRHVHYKGIKYLIRCVPMLKQDAVVLIAGTGVQTAQLMAQAKDNPSIHFIGRVPNEHIKFYLYASSVFAFPSIDRREAFGVALAEALYCGLPAVSFHIDGSGTTFVNRDNQTGLVVPNRDCEAFADAVNRLLEDEPLRKRLSQGAKQWARERFLSDQVLLLNQVYG